MIVSSSKIQEQLRLGNPVCFPTETVYGLGCDPRSHTGVDEIVRRKERNQNEGMPLIAHDVAHALGVLALSAQVANRVSEFVAAFWPGPLTLVAMASPATHQFHPQVFGRDRTIAIRVSSLALARSLAEVCGGTIIATSANAHGKPPAQTALEAHSYFPDLYVLQESVTAGVTENSDNTPSTILDVRTFPFRVLREGAIPKTVLGAYL